MKMIKHYDFCFIGSGQVVNRLLRESQISRCKSLVVSDQLSNQSHVHKNVNNVLVLSRKQFIEAKREFTIGTLIISVKTNRWSNVIEFDRLLTSILYCSVSKVIVLSSGAVYGETAEFVNEDSVVQPLNSYGRQKLVEELKILKVLERDAQIMILRISNVYGDRAFRDFVNCCIESAIAEIPVPVFSQGGLRRDLIFIEDLTQIIGQLIYLKQNSYLNCLNVSSGIGVSTSMLISQISQILSIEINQLETPQPSDVANSSVLNNSKLKDWVPFTFHTLEEGLTAYISSQFPELCKSR